ncbi:DsbA family protein [Pseudoalteromonas agarivorans]|uniref:DsbA family protein n=1 Tax=Pseudoalteromonas agarivorans TaxID=176102 RepID=UPI00311D8135
MTQSKLIYVHDPMCSWCWGFRPTWLNLKSELENNFKDILTIEYKVGGLAPDSQAPMPQNMQDMLQNTWRKIAAQLGTQFNYAFWQECQPRRSTYPACRAALIARKANKEADMVAAIQHAYYLNAQNPSDEKTLIELAQHIGLDKADFESSLQSNQINDELNKELAYAHSLPIQGFPSLVLINNDKAFPIDINYTDWQQSFNKISALLK